MAEMMDYDGNYSSLPYQDSRKRRAATTTPDENDATNNLRSAQTKQAGLTDGNSSSFFANLEKTFVVLAFLVYAGSLVTVLGQNPGMAGDGVRTDLPLLRAIYAGTYAVTCLLIIVRSKYLVYVVTREPLLMLLVGLAWISVLWSVEASLTLRQGVAVLGTTLFGVYLAVRFSFREQLRLLAWALGIAALLSVAFVLALPTYGIMTEARGEVWRGIFNHKNTLGRLMALSAVVFLILALDGRKYRGFLWAGFGLSLGVLLMSSSKTALAALLLILALLPLRRISRERYTLAIPFFIMMVLAGGAAVLWFSVNAEGTLALFGRDTTLTGRTEIWQAVLDMIWRRPWLGYGYGAFWQGYAGESAYVWLVLPENNYPMHAHNGFLDLWIDLGLVGLLLFLAVFLRAFARAISRIFWGGSADEFWPLAFLMFMLYCGTAYPVGMERNSIWWVIFVAVVFGLAAHPRHAKNEPHSKGCAYSEKRRSRVG